MAVNRRFWVGVVCGAAILIVAVYAAMQVPAQNRQSAAALTPQNGQAMLPTKQITIDSVPLTVEVASTPGEQENGLSGRSNLADGTGMLFVFPGNTAGSFWMKDMRFSLDIIFADASGSIVTIYPALSPATYPSVFGPTTPAQYVLEVPAGFAATHGIAVGQKIVVQ